MGNTYTKEPFLKMIGPTDNINDYAAYFGTILTTLFIGVISYLLFKEFNNRYEVAKPNEWLLLIENGALKRAGVGLAVFRNVSAGNDFVKQLIESIIRSTVA